MDLDNNDQQNAGNNAAAGGAGTGVTPGVLPEAQGARTALRRRLILGGLVGIPAALAVMKPVKTLAKSKKKKACSYSGWHSFKLNPNTSAQPNKSKKCKSGFNQKFFYSKAKKKLPKNKKSRNNSNYNKIYNHSGSLVTIYQNTTFSSLFGSGSSSTIMSILGGGSSTNSAFLTALFNAYWLNGSGYPYTCAEIYKLWGQTSNQANIALFLQQLDSFS